MTPLTAANKPVEVPSAFKANLKAHFDRDEWLGVIKSVPPNTPHTFCVRMLVVAKNNGKPRQRLNSRH